MAPSKKLIINNFKGFSTVSDKYLQEEWSKLERDVRAIQNSQALQCSLEELYRSVENLCSYGQASFVYENLCHLIDIHFKSKLVTLLKEIDFLGTMNYNWVTFCRQTNLLRNIFLYLDRTYVLRNQCLLSIWHVSLGFFKKNIIYNQIVQTKLFDGLIYLVKQERYGTVIDSNLLKSLITMLTTLEVYDVFEWRFLHETKAMYAEEGKTLIEEYDIRRYLKHVKNRFDEENKRVENYFKSYTAYSLSNVVVNQLIGDHLKKILETGVNYLIQNNSLEELTLLYKLLSFVVNGRDELCKSFSDHLKRRGRLIVTDMENDKSMIQDLIDFKNKIDNIVTTCFQNNDKFCEAVKGSFKFFINQRHNKPSELLAKFVDSKLRCKELAEQELEAIMNKVMVLFRFVQGKDVFEAFYKRDLAKRLLVGKSTSQDAENSMIGKLRQECGNMFTAKFEGMFKDITISQGINTAFKQHLNYIHNVGDSCTTLNIDMCVNVLTSSFWPNYPLYEVNLPSEMVVYQSIFMKFYMGNHSGRKLQWQPNLGHCIIKADFSHGRKELQVSLFQTIVLLLFNNDTKMTYKEIHEALNLEPKELKRTLQSLACGRNRVLLKTPKGKDIEEDDTFVFNNEFTDKLFRVKINQVQMKETVEEQRATEESVIQDRQFQIDAAIVRIMKKMKSSSHNVLLSELYKVLDIPVKPTDLKKRIETLIDRDYIERDQDNATIYKYIA